MRYLGLDLGSKTVGVSLSDESGTIASTYKTIFYSDNDKLLIALKEIIDLFNIKTIILGFPKNMNNSIGPKGLLTLEFKDLLEKKFAVDVFMQDERLTTKQATFYMLAADVSRKKRKKKIDSLAANIILQTYLDKMKGRIENE
ncbi:MAG: Holliday junction resolvase RuvX [Bacilli bacterium]